MTTKQNENSGCGKAIAIIGLIASLIAIFTFLTGIVSIMDFTGASQKPENNPQPVSTVDYGNNSVSEQATLSAPTLQDKSKGGVKVTITGGNNPLPNIPIVFAPATKDISGKWTAKFEGGNLYSTDSNGIIETDLDSGTYALLDRSGASRNNDCLGGSWGITGSDANGNEIEMAIFSISTGIVTNVDIPLARLDVGLLSAIDGSAIKGEPVMVSIQILDIAGNKIERDEYGPCSYNLTDERGIASLNLGAGTYIVKVSGGQGELKVYDLSLQAGETRKEIYQISSP